MAVYASLTLIPRRGIWNIGLRRRRQSSLTYGQGLQGEGIGDEGANSLAEALLVNASLTRLNHVANRVM